MSDDEHQPEQDHDQDEECMADAKMKKNLLDNDAAATTTQEGCCSNCLRCLAGISCRTLSAFVLMLVGIGGFAGGFIIGIKRSRELIDKRMSPEPAPTALGLSSENTSEITNGSYNSSESIFLAEDDFTIMPVYMEYIVMGVCIGTGVFGILFFIVGSLSTGWTSRHVFNTSKKNGCARALNIICLIFAFVLHLGWQGITCIMMVPVVLLAVIKIINVQDAVDCLNLQNYAFPKMRSIECGNAFDLFVKEGMDVLICWAVAVASAIVVVFSLAFFIVCMGSDYRHLQETKFATYNNYEKADGRGNSQESVLDTKM
ncbi:uncharacterized protein LOC135494117 isoform X2 [Lineus longissimus]|uniref:uncharacterized protein LOC135494117 isoform X2 n=1 Tax=Lineus longissimus TaxID=88925 RepID=UPI002B4D847E